jgi:hypothetical protein
MARIEKLVPLIGPTVVGPLGIMHVPRMWYKSALSASGRLAEGYVDSYRGFNQYVLDGLGVEPEPWFAFLATRPAYPQAEDYLREHATKLDAASIAAVNELITTRPRREESAAPVRALVGISDATYNNGARLLDFEDWHTIHDDLLAHAGAGIEPIVPMVSSSEMGFLEIPHLPRLWIKALLNALHALPAEWKTGINCGFDRRVAGMIGLDIEAATAYIQREVPHYLAFEQWVREQIGDPDEQKKSAWRSEIFALQKNDEQFQGDLPETGMPALTSHNTILINDLVDWYHMHAALTAPLVK